ncbi:MAG: hypothetical protein V1707_02730 [bacterium]
MKKQPYNSFWRLGRPEHNTQYYSINADGELVINEGHYQYNIHDLIKKYGTSLEIVLPFVIEQRLEDLFDTFAKHSYLQKYRGKFSYFLPLKTNQNKELVLPALSEGANLETSSANELWLIRRLFEQEQFNPDLRLLCNGPKTVSYFSLINDLQAKGVNVIPIIEDINELEMLKVYKGEVGIRVELGLRINSHWDKRVGRFGLVANEILKLGRIRNLKILHYHIGSQVESLKDMLTAASQAMELFIELKKANPSLDTLDLGGGLPVPYDQNQTFTLDQFVSKLLGRIKKMADHANLSHPNLIGEWGRYIMAPAQMSIFQVVWDKKITVRTGAKSWYVIDGSFMNDLLDTWAIHQKWQIVPVNNANSKKLKKVWLAGSSCDSDDKYTAGGGGVLLPDLDSLEDKQYLAIFDTGAYQDALASHHCLLSSPAKIVLQDGKVTVARKRETAAEVGKMFGW